MRGGNYLGRKSSLLEKLKVRQCMGVREVKWFSLSEALNEEVGRKIQKCWSRKG